MKRLLACGLSLGLVAAMAVPAMANSAQDYPLLAGQDMPAGKVLISTDNGNINVEIDLNDGWCMTAAHVDQARTYGDLPTNKAGNPKIGQFEKNVSYQQCVSGDTFAFPASGGTLFAVHAVVAKKYAPGSFWAAKVVKAVQGVKKDGSPVAASRSIPKNALVGDYLGGNNPTTFYSLGFNGPTVDAPGKIVVSFGCRVLNLGGKDLGIWEATNGNYPLEKARVEVSKNKADWEWVGTAKNLGTGPNRASKVDVTPLPWFKYVRLSDTTVKSIHNGNADGFDVDGVKALQKCGKFETAWGKGTPFPGNSWAMYIEYDR